MQSEQRQLGEIGRKIRGMNLSTVIPYLVTTLMRKGHITLWKLY